MLANLAISPLEMVGKITDHLTNLAGNKLIEGNDSLVQVSQVARVEPIMLVDQRAQALPYIADVAQSMNSIFTGYYLQAVALSCNVGRINVVKLLDRLSPDRLGWSEHLFNKLSVSNESLLKLPDFSLENFGLEAQVDFPATIKGENLVTDTKDVKGVRAGASKDVSAVINESVNLSVGKMIEVTIKDGDASATFPITIRLLATIMDPQSLVHILSDNSRDTGFRERWHQWRSGELRFWKDLVACQDLINEHRYAMMKDSSNVHADMMERRRNNAKSALVSGTPSAATASNLVIITSDSAKELERRIGGRLKDFNVRKRVFDSTYLMIMAVVDPEWEHVTFYHNGISSATSLSLNEIKNSNKGTGPDVMEILKAFQLGNSPL